MKRVWNPDELADQWTLTPRERVLVGWQKGDHTALGFAVLLKYVQIDGRFPRTRHEVPPAAIAHLAHQLSLPATAFIAYDWEGRTIKLHRAAIREFLTLREATVADQEMLTAWLVERHVPTTRQIPALIEHVKTRCRDLHLELPTPDRVERLVRTAIATFDAQLTAQIVARLSPATCERLDALLHERPPSAPVISGRGHTLLADLKRDAGSLSLQTVKHEKAKLDIIAALELPANLFAGVSPRLLRHYREQVATEDIQALQDHSDPRTWVLLAAFCLLRRQEILDTLADLLLDVVQHLGVKAEHKIERELMRDLKRISGKNTMLYQLAEAAIEHPDEPVREALYPVLGEQTLRELVREYRTSGPTYHQRVYTVMRGSYQHHYRQVVPLLLEVLQFHSNNASYQPIIAALDLLKRYHEAAPQQATFAPDEVVPLDGVVPARWREIVVQAGEDGAERVNRINYELSVLHTVREKLRCKELWLADADRFRNPDDDLPADFAEHREANYAALNLPSDATAFTSDLRARMETALQQLNDTLPSNRHVAITEKAGGWIKLSPLEPQPEPPQLPLLKAALRQHWSMLNLLDVLKETDLRVLFTQHLRSVTGRDHLDSKTLQRRLLLCLYGLGTNIGLKRVGASEHDDNYRDLLYVRRRFISRENLRAAIAAVVNALFAARKGDIWGDATTACASDSKKFSAWDQNLLTEWSLRHRGPGVMIYWHVDRKAACIYSQLKSCTSSEVAAMITGVIRHCTEMSVQKQYVDSHGQSEVAFAFCNLLGFQLLPRLKGIHRQKLYRPQVGQAEAYPNLQLVLTRPIKWELIEQQYDEIVKYVTAVRLGTAEPEAILRRFTRTAVQHPTYQAIAEVGKVYKTLFLCEYLQSMELRREIHEGLNVVENWNSANTFIFYGKSSEISTNRREDQEVAMLSLHLLQLSLVYINTLLLQQVLSRPEWQNRLTKEDLRGLTPLIYGHINPYGLIQLNMDTRIPIEENQAA